MMEVHKAHTSIVNYVLQILRIILMLQLPLSVAGIDCSTEITGLANGETGVIHSPGFPESYPQGSGYRCTYQLSILGPGFITISFADFHLHDTPVFTCKNNGTYDYLTINLHNNQNPTYYCSVKRPPTIIAPKKKVTVELVVHAASSSVPFRGFQMHYTFITEMQKEELSSNFHVEQTLVPTFSDDEGSFNVQPITAPPSYSSQSLDIIWYVTAPTEDDRIQLTVTDIYPPYIPAPMLLIADGPTSKSTALQHGVHVDTSPFVSSQRFMLVRLMGSFGAGMVFEVEFSFFRDPDHNGNCPEGFVKCKRSDQCIRDHLLCNERGNCRQKEDEDKCNSVSTNSNPDLEHTSIMIGAFVGAVCLLSICWLVAMARKRYTETEDQQQGGRPPQRMISIHSPEELGLRRSTTNGPGDLEIPPEYSEVFIEENKPVPASRPSIISASEPLSPPPSYDIVTGHEDLGIVMEFPAAESSNLPDVVNQNESDSSSLTHSNSPRDAANSIENVSRQTSRSTDV